MKPSLVAPALKHLLGQNLVPFLWGPPGAGKSAIVKAVARDMERELRDVRLSQLDPTDLKGFPVIGEQQIEIPPAKKGGKPTFETRKTMAWAQPDFLPTSGSGILFLDELNSAPPAVQATTYQLMTDRRIGDYVLPEGWGVVAAGNRMSDRALVNVMPSALNNRVVHIDFDVDHNDWYAWAAVNQIRDEVRGFIRFRSHLLHNFDPSKNERAFPTPRSWEYVSKLMGSGMSPDVELELIKGTVGEGAAAEFLAYAKDAANLPTPDEVLMNPDSAPVPDTPSGKYAICTSLDRVATANSMARLLKYVERLPPEFQVMFMRSCSLTNRSVMSCKPYIDWITKNQDLVL